jgi:hypothetical protein
MRKLYALFIVVLIILANVTTSVAQRLLYHRVTTKVSPEKLEYLFNHGLDIDHFSYENKLNFTAELSDQQVELLKRSGLKVTYVIRDLEKNLQAHNEKLDQLAAKASRNARAAAVSTPTNFSLGSYAGFYTFAEMQTILDKMRTMYPNLVSARSSIGTTLEGRPLLMVKISDNPDVVENEPKLMLNAVHHAREPISMTQLMYFMWHLLENYSKDKEIQTLLNSTEIYIVPCLNPDGYVYNQTTNPSGGGMWRKNRQINSGGSYGVDINRNYAYYYALDNSGSSPTQTAENYRGTGAFSEKETQAMRDLFLKYPFTTVFNYHSYANACMYPFSALNPNSNPEMSTFRAAATYLAADNGFKIGNTYETLGYTSNGGAPDWQYGEQSTKAKTYAFTTEIGSSDDGFWPASSRILPLCNSTIEMNRKMLRMSTNYGRAAQRGVTTFSAKSSVLRYNFTNYGIKPGALGMSVKGLSSYVTSVGSAKTYSGMGLLQTVADSLQFTVSDSTPVGASIAFELAVDNGMSIIKDTLTLTYTRDCGTPTSLVSNSVGQTTATLSWSAIAGAASYAVSTKPKSSTAWSADVTVSNTSYPVSSLTPATAYDWRVKAVCGTTYATSSFTTSKQICFKESGGTVVFEAENFKTSTAGTGSAAGRTWVPVAYTSASSGAAVAVAGTGLDVQNGLNGPRLDYTLTFATTGTYYVWVRMVAGSGGTSDDSFTIGLDGAAVNLSPNTTNFNNGNKASWTWIKAAGSTAFKVTVNTAGEHTFNLWMREDGTIVDKFILTTSSSYSPSSTGPVVSGVCTTTAGARELVTAEYVDEAVEGLQVNAYPNPLEQSLTIDVNPTGQEASLRLIDINGRIQKQAVLPANQTQHTMPVGPLQTGAYFLEVIRGDKRKVIQLRRQ